MLQPENSGRIAPSTGAGRKMYVHGDWSVGKEFTQFNNNSIRGSLTGRYALVILDYLE